MKDFVFIITYGRSGSTLLQGILNSIKGYKITGENENGLYLLFKFDQTRIQSLANYYTCMQNFNIQKQQNPWWNEVNVTQLRDDLRQIITHMIDPDNEAETLGFKEIRYTSIKDLEDYLDWMYALLGCRFIFLTRNLDDVLKSEWHKNNPEGDGKSIIQFEERIKKYMTMHENQQWYHITYEQITQGDLKGLFKFLGKRYNATKIKRVLATPHGYKTDGKVKTS